LGGDPRQSRGYLRRTLYNLAADNWRHQGARRKVLGLLRAAQPGVAGDSTDEVDLRDALIRLLLQLPPRQRAVIVLRYWEQLTETESAEALGCSVGTIKAAASRGLARMRELSIGHGDAQAQPEQEATA
jgi:RNA polymerase sigma factor (sigma-70 family)